MCMFYVCTCVYVSMCVNMSVSLCLYRQTHMLQTNFTYISNIRLYTNVLEHLYEYVVV